MSDQKQFMLLDVDVMWEATTPDPGHNFYFEPQGPKVWGKNFADADIYQRLEIIGKPSDQLLEGWLCIWNPRWDREVCTYAADGDQTKWPVYRFTRDGVYYVRWPSIDTWVGAHGKHEMKFDAEAPVTHLLIQLFGVFYDPKGQFNDASGRYNVLKLREHHWTNNEDLMKHLPFRMKSQVMVVRKGEQLALPPTWSDAPAAWRRGE
jgi:hypothetical protein